MNDKKEILACLASLARSIAINAEKLDDLIRYNLTRYKYDYGPSPTPGPDKTLDDLNQAIHALEAIKMHEETAYPSVYKQSAVYHIACRGLGEEG